MAKNIKFKIKINFVMNTLLSASNNVMNITALITPNLYMIGNSADWNRLITPNVRPVPILGVSEKKIQT